MSRGRPPAGGGKLLGPVVLLVTSLSAMAMTPSCDRSRPPCDLSGLDDENVAEIIGPTYSGVVPRVEALEVLATEPPSDAERAEIRDFVHCPVTVKVVQYTRSELEEFSENAFAVNARLRASRNFSVSLDYESNSISAESSEDPFPAELRDRILEVVPSDAIKFVGGVEEQRVP